MTLKEYAIEFLRQRDELERLKDLCAEAQKTFDQLRMVTIPEAMVEEGASSVNFPGVGRLGVTPDMHAGIQPNMQEAAYEWLEAEGHKDLIKDYVHSSTLKAFLKSQVEEGNEFPTDIFRIFPFLRASVTKT